MTTFATKALPGNHVLRALAGLALFLLAALTATPAMAGESDGAWALSGETGMESRYFPESAAWPGQGGDTQGSWFANLEVRWRHEDGNQRASIKPFLRLDGTDSKRSHVDLREAYWAREGDGWEFLAGANRVFWGVTESRHLVDIINQTDLVEDIDQEDKLGQPMIRTLLQRDWGQIEFYVMPWFRERTFPGRDGRLRPPLPVDGDGAVYESAAGQHHTDVALRWSHYFGDVDIGVSAFRGTGREPKLVAAVEGDRLLPYYHQITQFGLDLQYTRDAWLWKLEAIARDGLDDQFLAGVGGFEYTFYGVRDSAIDVGLLVEYLYDGRAASEPVTSFDNDLFIGSRLAFNDTQDSSLLAGIVLDRHESEWFFNLEAERRLGENYTVEGRLRLFRGAAAGGPLFSVDRDDYLQISIARYF